MDDLLVNRHVFIKHYNCALYDVESIPLEERQHSIHGVYMVSISMFLEVLCGLCLYAISRPQLISSPSYKLMFALELSEMIEIFVVGIAAAIFGFFGMVYCSNPTVSYLVGATATGIWYFEGQISVVLAFNRCLIMYDGNYAKQFFDGYKVFVYILFAILSAVCMLGFGAPVVYSGAGGGFFFDPHVGYLSRDPYFFNQLHFVFNHAVPLALIIIYVVFGILIYRQKKLGRRHHVIAKKELSLFFQISIICFLTIISCIGYAYEGFFDQYKVLVTITADAYLLYLGSPAFVYLLLNKSIRREVTKLLTWLLTSSDVVSFDTETDSKNTKTVRQESRS
ncbi:serpentine type 7TM GPCR chemoreceptor srt domain-containing protein [Ditylenchus destructor]|uniref:Serpentine type 7TM GPCR chemoreceptor srt domain-containing protein n=1 Tax=Ditylenchus destructor TaxID=166010 RepID=A0AAD4MVC7_9BILA|nr:serpentine type 7TM GPCR chemoreceptor srt domain-containing protein [Ditylenchus destructor]